MAIFISIVLYNFVILYHLIKTKRIITRYHIIIYVSALCAAILFTSAFTLKLNSLAYEWIRFFQSIFIYIGFYTLLFFWHSIAISVNDSRYLQLLRYVIIFSSVTMIIERILYFICEFTPPFVGQSIMRIACARFTSAIQIIIVITFMYYGIIFWLKQDNLLTNSSAKHALLLVTKICAIFSLGFLMMFTSNIMENTSAWRFGVAAELARVVLFKISCIIRISVLLFIIDLRPKSDSRHNYKAAINVNNKSDTTTWVQNMQIRHTPCNSALMSSNIDPDTQTIVKNATYYSTTSAHS
ncbi:hypothetical protein BDF19DRAFT_232138 [Syncephalis fuscata]|nr:hypothetical protein BDF19DRAFT_232138 [Syncephalis fuscata]